MSGAPWSPFRRRGERPCGHARELERAFSTGIDAALEQHAEACAWCGRVLTTHRRLVELGRARPAAVPDAARMEEVRTAVIAMASASARPRRRAYSRRWKLAAAGWISALSLGALAMTVRTRAPTTSIVGASSGATSETAARRHGGNRGASGAALAPAPSSAPDPTRTPPWTAAAVAPAAPTRPARSAHAPPAPRPTPLARAASPSVPTDANIAADPAAAERAFHRGWQSLRTGDASGATDAFAEVIRAAPSSALAEDASFWRAVALHRAGQREPSCGALGVFIDGYPTSPRRGEASVMLGTWLLEAGDPAAAATRFAAALDDPSAAVRERARAGRIKASLSTP